VLPSVLGSTPYACRPDAGYLVTGGLGALGIEAAEWLAARGARWIVLAGRRGVPPEPLTRLIGRLASEGIRLLPVALDVADSKAAHALKTRLAADGWPALRGIVHAAGVARDALLTETSIEALQDVLRAKVDGTLVLGSLFPHLDFSLFFSSVGALIGHPGQGSYAAANACLDALAQRRSHRETRTVSVAWPVWKGRGFAATPGGKEIAEHLASLGIGPLGEAEGSAALDMVLDAGPSHVAVLPRVEPGKEHVVSSPAVDTLLEEFRDGSASGQERHQTSSTATPGSGIMELLKAGAPDRRKEQLEAHLRGRAAEVLKISPSRLERAVPFGSYGLTSLLALELRRRLEADFSLVLSATLLFNYPTLDRLGEYLLSRLSFADMPVTEAASGTPAGKGAAAEPANLVHDARTISDDEALRALKSAPRRRPKP
jgi:NAD(P)-dependent dehydrogenase (short-subunit alcohol dehydrogenase family)/acyl carrier protein